MKDLAEQITDALLDMRSEAIAKRERKYCPSCGQADVSVGLDCVLRETFPQVRNHACGVGGPGSSAVSA